MAKEKKAPKVSVLERRLENPFGSPSVEINLKGGQKWALRIINVNVRSGRVYEVIHHKGWEFVTPDELEQKPDEIGFRVMDNRVVRGEKGEEVLVKMPQSAYDQILAAKTRQNLKGISKKATLETAANMAANNPAMGDQAAETIYRSNMTIEDSRVSVDLEGEAAS